MKTTFAARLLVVVVAAATTVVAQLAVSPVCPEQKMLPCAGRSGGLFARPSLSVWVCEVNPKKKNPSRYRYRTECIPQIAFDEAKHTCGPCPSDELKRCRCECEITRDGIPTGRLGVRVLRTRRNGTTIEHCMAKGKANRLVNTSRTRACSRSCLV